MFLVPACIVLTPLSAAGCASLIGLDDLERASCAGACAGNEPDTGGSPLGGRSGGESSGDAPVGVSGALVVAGSGAAQNAPGGSTNNDPAAGPNGGATGSGAAGATNAGATNAGAAGGNGGADPGTTAGGPSTGGTDPGSGGLAGSAGGSGQTPSSGGDVSVALPVRINFQPLGAPIPAGYVPDTGLTFASRDGLSFGWNVDHTDVTRDRGVNSSQLLDTLCQFHEGGVWELALPNGRYSVLASVGDPSIQSIYTLVVEGVTYWRVRAIGPNQFLSNTSLITISDGRLTISQGDAPELATRINYIEISAP